MSTTKDRSQAAYYAGDGRAPTVLEMEQGMVDRGAELSWLSQCTPRPVLRLPPPVPARLMT